ncbi:hypothetical protein ACFLZ1_02215 [Patescibacteria group bacterium]
MEGSSVPPPDNSSSNNQFNPTTNSPNINPAPTPPEPTSSHPVNPEPTTPPQPSIPPSDPSISPPEPPSTFPSTPPDEPDKPLTPTLYDPVKYDQEKTLKSKLFNTTFLVIIFLLLIFTLMGGFMYAIAYEKISFGFKSFEEPIRRFVLSLPFTPKSPKFLLEASTYSHSQVSSHSFNISLAAESNEITSSLGLNKIDLEIKGDIDYSDPINVIMSLDASITKDFNVEVRKKDPIIYFKINKLPPTLLALLDPDEVIAPILANWISYDTSTLQTEARKQLDENKEPQSLTDEVIKDTTEKFLDEKILAAINVKKEDLNSNKTYKLTLNATDEMVDYMGKKFTDEIKKEIRPKIYDVELEEKQEIKYSDVVKDLKVNIWIDQKKYYVRKITVAFKLNPNLPESNSSSTNFFLPIPSEPSETEIVAVMEFDNFGKKFVVEGPAESITLEEFIKKIQQAMLAKSQSEPKIEASMIQVQTALDIYYATNNTCPSYLEQLVPTYLPKIPGSADEGFSFSYKAEESGKSCRACVIQEGKEQDCISIPTVY